MTEGALSDYDKAVTGAKETLTALRKDGAADRQFAKLQSWWDEHLAVYQCDLPDEDAQRMLNTWNPLQCVQTARYSRSISSDASGVRGIGFRDTAQDMLAQAYRKPEWATEMLWYLASQQLEDGHAIHTAWPEEKRPPQDITRSDDHIWMVYLAYAIAAETGDLRFLDKEIPFLGTDLVTPVGSATLWEHLLRGVDFTEKHLGEHGLPLILFSDWNDHLGPFGRKGKGESIMVSQQHIAALRQLAELAEARGESAEPFRKLMEKQEKALEQIAWGCVSQVTGTAAWMDVVATQYLLGIRPTLKGLLIDPSIPAEWDGFTVERSFRGCHLTIEVVNPDHVQHGVKEIRVDGKKVDLRNGPLLTESFLNGRSKASIQRFAGKNPGNRDLHLESCRRRRDPQHAAHHYFQQCF